jgi:hypothetical protein
VSCVDELLRAVAAYAAGGRAALANLRADSARKLLTQLKQPAKTVSIQCSPPLF